ncbi:FecR family protein [Spirosoma sordidisoli]|uniref:DUF4974 domain-containing protein n=1 Tax=Spirosoma sordidisoli TaxID=2502893 RepID=A0A4Q2UHM8_9BACT|nr:FecR domain-containing protein [Spirosoma sordidisoli]RYC68022.1 DUF4974 domain-containing protein [Spirosoma sordidisoli]
MLPAIDKQLLFDHFADKTTPLQKRQIEEWLGSEANREQFYAWLSEWEQHNASYLPALEEPLQRFVDHMNKVPSGLADVDADKLRPLEVVTQRRGVRSPWGWLAAASVLVGGLFLGWQYQETILYKTYQTVYGETKPVLLSDGSRVFLQANSLLRVPRFGFSERSREVWLKGEAGFVVTHTDNNLKFQVKTDKSFDVVVHGTEFTVNTRSYRANVMLRKGKVQVNCNLGKTQNQIFLKPGDLVSLEQPNRPQIQHQIKPQVYEQWKERRFVFDNMSLQAFGQLLTENYGLSVTISDSAIAQRTLVGSFRADNVDELLELVAEIFDLKVTRDGNTVRLSEVD